MTQAPEGDVRAFGKAMTQIYHEARKEGYVASYFLRMLSELGPVETARKLIATETPSEGFARLFELGRLDLTVEALVLERRWYELFTPQERRRARDRLIAHGWAGGRA